MSACHACAGKLARNHRFCPHCGAAAEAASEAAAAPADKQSAAPRRRKMLLERKQVTALFVDLCDSTANVQHSDPEEARAYLEDALKLMTDAVDAYGGTVSQLLGDGLLALFGAPLAQEDHALRACLAAQAMQKASRSTSGAHKAPTVVRIGLHSGEVIVGVAGQYLWSHYRADGTTIHIASRLEKLAQPGTVVLSAVTQRLVAEQIDTEPLGAFSIRGFDQPLELYRLALAAEGSAAAPLARRQRWAPMVGREEILQQLDGLARAALGGVVHVVGLRGEAGIGKSRLIAEWCASPALRQFNVCTTLARGYASANSYGVITEVARGLVGLGPRPVVPDPHLSALNDLLEQGSTDHAWVGLSPAVRRRRVVESLHWLIADRLQLGALVLVVEDIFLADRESQRVLEALVPRLEGLPLLLCVSYRQDFAHRWVDAPWFVEHWLAPLPETDMHALAHAMLGHDDSVRAIIDEAVERADGNPFFLEQLAITLIDEGAMVGTPGAYRLTRPLADISTPASVSANICARLDRLPPEAKAAIEAAAVLGDPISCNLIGAMQGVEPARAAALLRLGLASGLLAAPDKAAAGDASAIFPFRHALVQEVVLATLTRPRRKALHRQALLALKQHGAAGDAELAPTLTRHAFNGEEWDQAATCAVKSMARAVSRSANREALRLFELGVEASRRVDNEPQALTLELGLLMEASAALMALGQTDAIFANLERAGSIAGKLENQRWQASVALQTSVFLWMRGRYTQGLEFATRALDAGRLAERRNLQLAALQSRMMMMHGLGRYREAAAEALLVQRDFAPELGQHRLLAGWATAPVINLCAFHGNSLWRMGDVAGAQALLDQAYGLLGDFDHPYSRGTIDVTQCHMWIEQGRIAEAEQLMRDSVDACIANDIPTLLPCAVAMLGNAMARGSRAAQAVELVEDALRRRIHVAAGSYGELYLRVSLGVALRHCGRLGDAIEASRQAVEMAVNGEQYGHSTEAMYELAQAYAAAGRQHDARATLERGLRQARLSEMPHFIALMENQLAQIPQEAAA